MENSNQKKTIFELNLSSFMMLLSLLFIGLKLGHVIDWSWWFVLSPIYAPFVLLYIALGIIWLIGWLLFRKKSNYRNIW